MSALGRRAWLLALCVLVASACSDGYEPEREQQDVLLSSAAAWLAEVRSVHLHVDGALASGDPDAAALLLRGQLARPVPPEVALAHARAVLQDLHYRLATLELDRGDANAALAAADAGLARGRVPDVFGANLLIARGAALEALGRDSEAASSYYGALEVNRLLLAQVLAAPDAGTPP